MDYYSLLGISSTADDKTIKKAFKKKAMEHHPDKGGDPETFKKINEAYQVLSNPQKKQMYDQHGFTDPSRSQQNYNFRTGPQGFNMDDIMSQFGFNARQQMRNRDITIGCNISIAEVFTGKSVIANYRLANGREQTIEIKIPVGVRQGDKIRYTGMGQHDIEGIPPGDLYVQIQIQDQNNFIVDGIDLLTSKRVSVLSLITGTKVKINIPGGSVIELKIKPGTQPDTTMRVTNKGLPNRSGNTGHLLVKIIGVVPTGLDQGDIEQIEYINNKYA